MGQNEEYPGSNELKSDRVKKGCKPVYIYLNSYIPIVSLGPKHPLLRFAICNSNTIY